MRSDLRPAAGRGLLTAGGLAPFLAGLCRPAGVGGVPGKFQGNVLRCAPRGRAAGSAGCPGLWAAPVLGPAAQMNTKPAPPSRGPLWKAANISNPANPDMLPCMARSGFGYAPKKSPPGKEAQNTSVCLWVTTARHADSRGMAAGRCKNMCARISLCEIPCLQGILKLNKSQVYCRGRRIHLEYPMENAVDMPSAHESAGCINTQVALIFCSLL